MVPSLLFYAAGLPPLETGVYDRVGQNARRLSDRIKGIESEHSQDIEQEKQC